MKPEIATAIVPLVLVAVGVQFSPLLTRRGIFFGATVDPAFPQSDDGRRVLRSYRWQAALWSALAILLATLLVRQDPVLAVFVPTFGLMVVAQLIYWLKFREVHGRYGVRRPEIRQASLGTVPEKETISHWLVLPPLLAITTVALYWHLHRKQMPPHIPRRWDFYTGQPIAWTSVDNMLLLASVMNLFILGLAWMMSLRSRRTVMRYVTVRSLELMLYPLTFACLAVSLMPVMPIPRWLLPSVPILFIVATIYWGYSRISSPSARDEVPEPQDDSYWKAGAFYNNPNDPAVWVSARVGIGYTMNFANKWSWVSMGVVLLAVAGLIYFASHIT